MANTIYPLIRNAIWSGQTDLMTGSTLKAALVSKSTGGAGNNYVYSAAHQYFSSVPPGAIVAAGVALADKVMTDGVLTAEQLVWPDVALNGSQRGEAVILYIDTGVAGASRLVAFFDVLDNLPVTPNGDDIKWSMPAGIVKSQLPA
jgi:hypothetical protein